ncbi:hypothetical protein A2U01_0097255, partial [Trifolium medium]|nr:hypothetical protein [Trifolium medium]
SSSGAEEVAISPMKARFADGRGWPTVRVI